MRKAKATLEFIKFTDAAKVMFCRHVIERMTAANTLFPAPDVPLIKASTAVDALEAAILAAGKGDYTAVAVMKAQIEITNTIFRHLVAYVNRIADGDEVMISSSGFNISSQPVMTAKPALTVTDSYASGGVKLVAKAVDRAAAYLWQYAKETELNVENDWIAAGTSTRASFEIGGLTIASKYYFRMAAVTPNVVTDYCAPVMKIVI